MGRTGIACPFCGDLLCMDTYSRKPLKIAPWFIVYCDNNKCPVQPSTDTMYPTAAFADVAAWGNISKEVTNEPD